MGRTRRAAAAFDPAPPRSRRPQGKPQPVRGGSRALGLRDPG